MINRANVLLFVEALESGEYHQIQGRLREDNYIRKCFCADGLSCNVFHETTGIGKWCDADEWEFIDFLDSSGENLLDGFYGTDLVLIYDGEPRYLIELNDNYGLTFIEIAKLIRQQLLGESHE